MILLDLDKTLINGDSAALWLEFCYEKKLIEAEVITQMQNFHEDYKKAKLDMNAYLPFFLSSVKDKSKNLVHSLVLEFITCKIEPIIYKKARELIAQNTHKRLILISATNDFIVKPIALKLGIKEVIATISELKNDIFTGKSIGVPSYQEGKVLRLKEYLGTEYEKLIKQAYFYTDSINDLALLEKVAFPVACNGDEKLSQIAKERNYTRLEF